MGVTDVSPSSSGDVDSSVETVAVATSSGQGASELGTASADSTEDLPSAVACSLYGNPSWVAEAGPHFMEPVGVLSDVAFADVTKASRGTRARPLESLNWGRVARVLRGRRAAPLAVRDPSVPGAPHLEPVATPDALCDQYGRAWPLKGNEDPDESPRIFGFSLPNVSLG